MDPQFNREPALRLPQPMSEQAAWPSGGALPGHTERAPVQEMTPQPSQSAPMTSVPAMPALQQTSLPASSMPTASPLPTQQVATATADDVNDERVWVERAKRIIEQTHADPFLESQEIGKFKAEYLKDVHAKNIKIAEG